MTFDDVVAGVQQRVSYLRCQVLDDAAADEGWLRVSDLVADPDRLEALIRTIGEARGAGDAQVAASLFVQSFAFRAPSLAVAAWALDLPSTTLDASEIGIRITRNRPGELGVWNTTTARHDAHSIAGAVVDGLVGPLVAAVRQRIKVGERILYGNSASSLATIVRAVQSTGPAGDSTVRERGVDLLDAHARLTGLGRWSTIETPESTGWYWDRGNCCLWYRSTEANGRYCDDCSLHDHDERAARRRAELTASPT